jgi:hypothetical protein
MSFRTTRITIQKMTELLEEIERNESEWSDNDGGKEKTDILNLKKYLLDYINIYCCHSFVRDSIDISPEKTIQIVYCKYCHVTKT